MDVVLELAERLDAADNPQAAWDAAMAALLRLDVPWCHHAHVAGESRPEQRPISLLRFSSLPPDWQEHHAAQRYWKVDAAIWHCRRSVAVLSIGLTHAEAAGDAAWAAMCREAEEAGLGDGLVVPLRGAAGSGWGGFSLVTRERGPGFAAWRAAKGREAVLIAQATAHRLMVLAEAEPPDPRLRLSPRERECLLWLVAGLRSDRIAEKLGLSRVTVDLHLARARRRLGAKTREQAVARALMLGLLRP
jgi:DNA-binding CsgD family transcriptional regulator